MIMDFIKKLLGKEDFVESAPEYNVKPHQRNDEDVLFDPMDLVETEQRFELEDDKPVYGEARNSQTIDFEAMQRASELSLEDGSEPSPSLAPAVGVVKGMAVVKKGGKVVFAIDCDMEDIPNWIEWDLSTNKMLLTFMGGQSVLLPSKIPSKEKDKFKGVDRVMLVARMDGNEIAHHIPLIVRQ